MPFLCPDQVEIFCLKEALKRKIQNCLKYLRLHTVKLLLGRFVFVGDLPTSSPFGLQWTSLPSGRPWRQPYPQRRREHYCPGHFHRCLALFWVCLSVCQVSILAHHSPGIVTLSRVPEPLSPQPSFKDTFQKLICLVDRPSQVSVPC